MDDNNNGVIGTEGQTAPVAPTTNPEETTPEPLADALSQSDYPEEPDKQRQAFYAMRKKIEELEAREKEHSQPSEDMDFINIARGTSSEYQPQPTAYQPQNPQGVEFDQTDPATQAFLSQAQKAQQDAQAARQDAMRAQAQLEDFEAWQKYPELNPKSSNRDALFAKDVQKEYITAKLEATAKGKAHPRLVDVADSVKKHYEEIRNQAAAQAAEKERQVIAQKEAAQLESQGTRVNLQETADETKVEQLRERVRRGDINALVELNKLTDPYIQSIPDDTPF